MSAAGVKEVSLPTMRARGHRRRRCPLLALLATAMLPLAESLAAGPEGELPSPEAVWEAIKTQHFGSRPIESGEGIITLEAPARAEEPAFTPIHIGLPAQVLSGARQLSRVLLFVDMNPEPLALELRGGYAGLPATFATRVRVERYSHVRAIAETNEGRLHMAEAFVEASGGCSAPPQARAGEGSVGEMRFSSPLGEGKQVQVSIRHPNASGLQRDPWTHDWIPPHFIRSLAVSHAGQLVFHARTGISMSENPTLRFTLPGNVGVAQLQVEAMDSTGELYQQEWRSSPSAEEE
ncbi:MAG TPA: quinoprotein dehydrogenase-associated SoxYZ-like carrier [Gammaproteobacteria bacterium]|nr:quinoprotein dehydrogenase-associated SoxYZ-like carrier [Gammaproteobacteria bacterium]